MDGLPPGYRWLNITANYLGFGLSPAVCICLVYVLDRKTALRREIRTAVRIEIGYLIFLFVTIPCGMVFSVSADNIYSRGPHFYIYIVMYFGAILYLSASTVITAREFQNRSRLLIYPLILFVMAETIIQVALPELHVTWLCVTLLSVLYFYLLQRDVESVGCTYRAFEPEQLSEADRWGEVQRRSAGRV